MAAGDYIFLIQYRYDLGIQAAVITYGRKECAQIDGQKCETFQGIAQKSRGDWDEDKANKEREDKKKEKKKEEKR